MPPKSRGEAIATGLQSLSKPDLTIRRFHSTEEQLDVPISPSNLQTSPSGPGLDYTEMRDQNDILLRSDASISEDSTSDDEDDRSPLTASTFFPPFYNRPPVPLPPSPSLTSLLRPSFSTGTSRLTTPESSDVDLLGGASTPASTTNLASITKTARHAPLVPRASPKVPTYEYYGFAMYLGSSAAFLLYIVWAYLPSPLLHQLGIHYYPNRWWALAVPCWLVVLVMYIYVALASYNTRYLTLPLSSCETIVDEAAQLALIDHRNGQIVGSQRLERSDGVEKEKAGQASARGSAHSLSAFQFSPTDDIDWKSCWSISTDAVMDVPMGGVCEVLYGSESED